MEDKGLINLTKTKDGFAANITGEGRLFQLEGGFHTETMDAINSEIQQLSKEVAEAQLTMMQTQDLIGQKKGRIWTRIFAITAIFISIFTLLWSVLSER